MSVISRLADQLARRELARTTASRDSWRRLARGLSHLTRRQATQIRHQNTIVQQMGEDLRRARGSADRWRVLHEDATRDLRKAQAHLDVCEIALAVAEEDAAKRRADL